MTLRTLLRVGLVILAAMQVLVGAWALVAPRAFYDGFPLPRHAWVALLPPYNEHLVRDVGALNLALTVVLGAAAWTLDRTMIRVALLALTVFAVPHAIFHAGHLAGFPGRRRCGTDCRDRPAARPHREPLRAGLAATRASTSEAHHQLKSRRALSVDRP